MALQFRKHICTLVGICVLTGAMLFAGCKGDSKQAEKAGYQPVAGDVLFQDHPSTQSMAIKLATHSEYTHCGVVFENNGKFVVYEATQPVVITPLDDWIANGVDSHFVARRLPDVAEKLTDETLTKMREIGESHMGKDYDLVFNWSDDKLYCSELVWKIYDQGAGIDLAPLHHLSEYDLSHPAVKAKLAERYGDSIPLDEPVIAPSDLFESTTLKTVYSN